MAATLAAACKSVNASLELELPLVSGCVGDGHALEFVNWRDTLDLPDPEMLIRNPESFQVPERGDKTYTILASVASAVIGNMNKTRYINAWTLFKMAADSGKKDLAAAAVRTLAQAAGKQGYMQDAEIRAKMVKNLQPFVEILKAAGLF